MGEPHAPNDSPSDGKPQKSFTDVFEGLAKIHLKIFAVISSGVIAHEVWNKGLNAFQNDMMKSLTVVTAFGIYYIVKDFRKK